MITYKCYISDKSKDTILLIHGWNTSSIYMEPFINAFYPTYNVINIDLFSHLDKPYSVDDFIEEIHQIVSKHVFARLVIIGHSFGGKLAYFYKEKYPCSHLILIAPSLISPRKSFVKWVKIKWYKLLKKYHLYIPKFLQGSKDFQNSTGVMKNTFLLCHRSYLKKYHPLSTGIIVYGFKDDKEVKPYQIKKIKKYLPRVKIIFNSGNHFAYLDLIKEIRLDFDDYIS